MNPRLKRSVAIIESDDIRSRIVFLRSHKVMLDTDLAKLYGVTTANLNKAVKRNAERFPNDFMFQLTRQEGENLIFQFGISSSSHGGRRSEPFVFTEQGVAMLSSVLKSKRAALVNIEIMRAFVRIREILSTHKDLARKIEELEKKFDRQFAVVFDALRQLMQPPEKPKLKMGFRPEDPDGARNVKRKQASRRGMVADAQSSKSCKG